ncbi:unnamed protein product [Calypogeia fissa]
MQFVAFREWLQDERPRFDHKLFLAASANFFVYGMAAIYGNLVSSRISNEEANHSVFTILFWHIPVSLAHYYPLAVVLVISWCACHKVFIYLQAGLPVVDARPQPQPQQAVHPAGPPQQGTGPPQPQCTHAQANGLPHPQATGHGQQNQGSGRSYANGTATPDPHYIPSSGIQSIEQMHRQPPDDPALDPFGTAVPLLQGTGPPQTQGTHTQASGLQGPPGTGQQNQGSGPSYANGTATPDPHCVQSSGTQSISPGQKNCRSSTLTIFTFTGSRT